MTVDAEAPGLDRALGGHPAITMITTFTTEDDRVGSLWFS
jgi:hypothetical protein